MSSAGPDPCTASDLGSPSAAGDLLVAESQEWIPLLRSLTADEHRRPTPCPGWNIRDVVAHCAAALRRIADDDLHDFSPEANQADIAARHGRAFDALVDELEAGISSTAQIINRVGARLNIIGLGEWIHAGDIRAALGEPRPYIGVDPDTALRLIKYASAERSVPPVCVHADGQHIHLGDWRLAESGTSPAKLTGDLDSIVRIFCGRPLDSCAVSVDGAGIADLSIYR